MVDGYLNNYNLINKSIIQAKWMKSLTWNFTKGIKCKQWTKPERCSQHTNFLFKKIELINSQHYFY